MGNLLGRKGHPRETRTYFLSLALESIFQKLRKHFLMTERQRLVNRGTGVHLLERRMVIVSGIDIAERRDINKAGKVGRV